MPDNIHDMVSGMSIDTPQSIDIRAFKAVIDETEQIKIASERKVMEIRKQLEKQMNISLESERLAEEKKELESAKELLSTKSGEELKSLKSLIRKKKSLIATMESDMASHREYIENRSIEIATKYEENYYKKINIFSKKRYAEDRKRLLEQQKDEIASLESEEEARATTLEERIEIATKYDELRKANQKELNAEIEKEAKLTEQIDKLNNSILGRIRKASKQKEAQEKLDSSKKKLDEKVEAEASLKAQRDDEIAAAGGDATKIAAINAKYDSQITDAEAETKSASKQVNTDTLIANALGAVQKSVEKVASAVSDKVNSAIETLKEYQSPIMARLQGSDSDYYGAVRTLKSNLAVSPYVSYEKTLKNLSELVDKGIAYNIEERAFLGTISEKIATTFDAFDSNLLRLIRLQQADTTAARLGMEADLTQFLNSLFSDTSYLSDVYDSVSAAIIDANSQLTYSRATEFEYILQKWMGSLYSLGFSQSAVSSIAEGINMLSTGDVKGLSGNESMQTLLAMSASRSNTVSYADALINGLDASQTNDLLKSMVEYLQEIANNSDNQVVKAAYGDIFDMSLSDLASIQNLNQTDIDNIYNQTLSYGGALKELTNQFNQVTNRLSLSEKLSNVFDNAMFSVGEGIASSAGTYVTWMITDLIQQATGGINLPAVSVMGNMIDLSAFTVEGIVKTGLVGLSTLAMIPSIISSISNGGGLGGDIFGNWNATQTTTRGTGVALGSNGTTSGTSESSYVGSSSSSDMKNSSVAQASEDSEDTKKITNPNADEDKTFNDLWKALYVEPVPIEVHSTNFDSFVKNVESLTQVLSESEGTKTLNVNVTNKEPIGVASEVRGFTADFESKLKSYFSTTLVKILSEASSSSSTTEDESATLKDLINKILTGKIDVNITNTDFDAYIQKNIFQY